MSGFNISIFRNNENIGVLSKGEVISLDFEQLDRANVADTIQVGLYSNTGRLSFVDRHNLKRLLDNSISLDDFLVLIAFASNVSTKRLCTMYVGDYDYSEETSVLTLMLTDNLTRLQDKEISRIYPFNPTPLSQLASSVAEQAEIKSIAVDNDITVDCPDIRVQSAWSALDEICAANFMRGFMDEYRNVRLTRDNPISNPSNPIVIQPRHILGIYNKIPNQKTRARNFSIKARSCPKYSQAQLGEKLSFDWYSLTLEGATWIGSGTMKSVQIDRGENIKAVVATATANIPDTTFSIDDTISMKGTVAWQWFDGGTVMEDPTEEDIAASHKSWDTSNSKVTFSFTRESAYYKSPSNGQIYVIKNGYAWLTGQYYDSKDVYRKYSFDTRLPTNEVPTSGLLQLANSNVEEMVEHIRSRYWYGVECCEMECLMNDYTYSDGSIAIDSQQAECFSKYQVVVPYVMRKGVTVPYRTYDDGTPKQFLIIGIKYSQLGIPRQTLYLQEYAPPNLFGTLSFNSSINRPDNDITLGFGGDDAVYGYFLNRSLEIERRKVSSIGIYAADTDEGTPLLIDSDNGLYLQYDGYRWWFYVDGARYEVGDYEELMGDSYTLFEIEQNPVIVTEEQKKWFNDNTTLTF
jgi:hypothetical protein